MQNYKTTIFIVISILALPVSVYPGYFEFQVSTDAGANPAVAMSNDGSFVIAWQSNGIYARRYYRTGEPTGDEFRVDEYLKDVRSPSIAMNEASGFIITWYGKDPESSEYEIYARRYKGNGYPYGNEFLVRTNSSTNNQVNPACGIDCLGNTVIAWLEASADYKTKDKIHASKFDPEGNLINQFIVTQNTYDYLKYPSVSMNSGGDFVITWMCDRADGNNYGIVAQRYNNLAEPIGYEFLVNSLTYGHQEYPSVALSDNGQFVIAWQSSTTSQGSSSGICAQRYDENGIAAGSEIVVFTVSGYRPKYPSVAIDSRGKFVIAWECETGGYPYEDNDIYAQRFYSDGSKLSDPFRVNNYGLGDQTSPSCGVSGDGNIIIAWEYENFETKVHNVFANYFNFNPTPVPTTLITETPYPTPTPSRTFIRTPTDTPQITPTLTASITPTPTLTATATRTSSTPYCGIYANGTSFKPGDTLIISAWVDCRQFSLVDLYIGIPISGLWFWYPAWDTMPHPIEFEWEYWKDDIAVMPLSEDRPVGTYTFYATLTFHGFYDQITSYNSVTITIE
ncbi:hypothetical protein KKB18_11160 [bacterium]|nr:hypothetical protein [bacterium]